MTAVSATTAAAASGARHASASGSDSTASVFYYTTTTPQTGAHGLSVANVWRANLTMVGGKPRIGERRGIAFVPHAQWIVRIPGGRLLVGSFGDGLLTVDPQTGRVAVVPTPEAVRAVALAPSGRAVWCVGRGGSLFKVPLGSRGHVRVHLVRGPDTDITSMAFARSGRAFYTAAGGDFGTLNLRRFETRRVYAHLVAARSVVFDRYTGSLLLTGGGRALQIDPQTLLVRSEVDLAGAASDTACDQASTDGSGNVMFACGRAIAVASLGRGARAAAAEPPRALSQPLPGLADIAPTFTAVTARTRSGHGRCRHFCTPLPVFTG